MVWTAAETLTAEVLLFSGGVIEEDVGSAADLAFRLASQASTSERSQTLLPPILCLLGIVPAFSQRQRVVLEAPKIFSAS